MKSQVNWRHREMERERAEREHRKMNTIRIFTVVYYLIQIFSVTMIYLAAHILHCAPSRDGKASTKGYNGWWISSRMRKLLSQSVALPILTTMLWIRRN